jgi:hypothetical protein
LTRKIQLSDVASGLTAVIGAGIIFIGARFLWLPKAGAEGYGVPARSCEEDSAYLTAKGVRDIATGLIALTLLALGDRRALGWVSLAAAIIPASDAAIVLRHKGSPAVAYGVHGVTATTVLVNALLLLKEDTQPSCHSDTLTP